ncbi:hypothetical protein CHCC20335_4364 [Bacillus paralicheniformis]|nr:hypothetical protein [Bacillus sonorensis]MCY8604545.1 hypothetical protein [Bacillus sonorensis]TWK84296.1 hypothetical protein CHCC20335_4364 [Bacillus paralicheniformis]
MKYATSINTGTNGAAGKTAPLLRRNAVLAWKREYADRITAAAFSL